MAPQGDRPATTPAGQDRLLRHLAHELRQPLSGIESIAYYLDMVLAGSEPEIQQQCDRLRRMVQHAHWLLEDASLAQRAAATTPGPADLGECLTRIAADCALHDERHLQLALQPGLRPAWALASLTYTLCDHLVSFYFGPAQTPDPLLITLAESEGWLHLEFSGEPAADLEDLQHALEPPPPVGGLRSALAACGGQVKIQTDGATLRVRCRFLPA